MRHMADIEAIHTFEGTETMQTLIVGRDITGSARSHDGGYRRPGSAGQSDQMSTTQMPPRPAAVVPGTYLTGPFAPVHGGGGHHGPSGGGCAARRSRRRLPPQRPEPAVHAARQLRLPARRRRHAARALVRRAVRPLPQPVRLDAGLVAEEAAGTRSGPGLIVTAYTPGADDVGPSLAAPSSDLPDINIVRHGGRLLALAEVARPTGSMAATWRPSAGRRSAAPCPRISAHPKIDPRTGEMVRVPLPLEAPFLTWSVVGPDGTARPPIDAGRRRRPAGS